MGELEQSAMRVGHAEREQVVARLNTAFAEGRLDVHELDERVTAAYAARTHGDLVPLTADLPVPYQASPVVPQPRSQPARRPGPMLPAEPSAIDWTPVGGAFALFAVNVLIWAVISISTGNLIYFWPIWTAIPLVFAVVGTVASRRRP